MLMMHELLEKLKNDEVVIFADGTRYVPNVGVRFFAKGKLVNKNQYENFLTFFLEYYRSFRNKLFIEHLYDEDIIHIDVPCEDEVFDFVKDFYFKTYAN